jgi:hypothetical protein
MYSDAAANGAPSMRVSKRPHSSAFQRLQICIEFTQPQYTAQAEQLGLLHYLENFLLLKVSIFLTLAN